MDKLIITQSRKALSIELFKIAVPFVIFLIIIVLVLTKVFASVVTRPVILTLGTLLFTFGSALLYFVLILTNRKWQTRRYEFYENNVHVLDSAFGSSHTSFGLGSVISVKVSQSLVGNFFNYGTITLNFFGGTTLDLENVPRPEEKLPKIQAFIDKAKS